VRLRGRRAMAVWRVRCLILRPSNKAARSTKFARCRRWKVRIFVEGIPANGVTYSVDSEVYQDAALDGVPEDLVTGLMETAERDFRRGLAQELITAEKATDDDIAAEIDKFTMRPPGTRSLDALLKRICDEGGRARPYNRPQ
jgi:hypothetical protein